MFDHYIALDWAQQNMALARMTRESRHIKVTDVPSNLKELKLYLKNLKGTKILTFEETHTAQWLYVELRKDVDEIVICDPYRNKLLSEGAKTDKIDAKKLVLLLRNQLLKPVFHRADQLMDLRKFVSGYEDMVQAGVRLKNQRAALLRSQGQGKHEKSIQGSMEQFVFSGIEDQILSYEKERERYKEMFQQLRNQHTSIRHLESLTGIGIVGATKIVARVVEARRFPNKGHWLSYCGLVRLQKESGGRSYGSKNPRYSRQMKSVFKTAAMNALYSAGENPLKVYYDDLLKTKNLAEHQARHAVARRIAVLALGVLKSEKPYRACERSAEIKEPI
jgi:transposase